MQWPEISDQEPSLFGLSIDQQTSDTLRTASQWGRFLSILGFILGALIMIFGIVVYSKITRSYSGFRSDYGSSLAQKLAMRYLIICLLFAAVMVTGGIFTLNFSNRVSTALNTNDQFLLNSGLAAIKGGIIFWSIVFVIFVLLMLLAFIGIFLS